MDLSPLPPAAEAGMEVSLNSDVAPDCCNSSVSAQALMSLVDFPALRQSELSGLMPRFTHRFVRIDWSCRCSMKPGRFGRPHSLGSSVMQRRSVHHCSHSETKSIAAFPDQ